MSDTPRASSGFEHRGFLLRSGRLVPHRWEDLKGTIDELEDAMLAAAIEVAQASTQDPTGPIAQRLRTELGQEAAHVVEHMPTPNVRALLTDFLAERIRKRFKRILHEEASADASKQ